jgi:D-arabinan exo alpha-(1,3)/(1,5)-arabinofuranosidase (non-reducing end)
MMKRLMLIAMAMTGALSGSAQQKTINMETELQRLSSVSSLPVYIANSQVGMESSYDRKGHNNDGFEGTYSFVRKNGDGTLVIFEAEGKGVIERIWTPTPTDDTLDFYFDGASSASFSINSTICFRVKFLPSLNL